MDSLGRFECIKQAWHIISEGVFSPLDLHWLVAYANVGVQGRSPLGVVYLDCGGTMPDQAGRKHENNICRVARCFSRMFFTNVQIARDVGEPRG
jgi:hypothetical protein